MVVGDGLAADGPGPGEDVDDPGGEASQQGQLGKLEGGQRGYLPIGDISLFPPANKQNSCFVVNNK